MNIETSPPPARRMGIHAENERLYSQIVTLKPGQWFYYEPNSTDKERLAESKRACSEADKHQRYMRAIQSVCSNVRSRAIYYGHKVAVFLDTSNPPRIVVAKPKETP